jgi:hypothetical protein
MFKARGKGKGNRTNVVSPERERQIREALSSGMPTHAVIERFSCGSETVLRILSRRPKTVPPYLCKCGLVTTFSPCQRCAAVNATRARAADPIEADEDAKEIESNGLPTSKEIAEMARQIREAHHQEMATGQPVEILEQIRAERDNPSLRIAGSVAMLQQAVCKSA